LLALAQAWTPPRFPLTGTDVMALGVAIGPEVGQRLAEAEAWWIARDFAPGRAALLAELKAKGMRP
jgi:poly(A) polymerase